MGNLCSVSHKEKDDTLSSNQPAGKIENTETITTCISRTSDEENTPIIDHLIITSDQGQIGNTIASNELLVDGNHIDTDCLTKNLEVLCKNLIANEVITSLESKIIITHVEAEEIRAEKTSYDQNLKLIHMVRKKGAEPIQCFISALKKTGQVYLAGILQKTRVSTDDISSSTKKVQIALRQMYSNLFKIINPFSLPFTFDFEKTWVSLALREDQNSEVTEEYGEMLKRAFSETKMLIVEGKPASGKTSLMRRFAYDWAKGAEQLEHYDLVFYVEFRQVREKQFKSIVDLVTAAYNSFLDEEKCTMIEQLISAENFFESHCVLMLFDGYDESLLERQCEELYQFLSGQTFFKLPMFDIVLSTRPGYLTKYRGQSGRFVFADVLGFTEERQKQKYILNHFSKHEADSPNVKAVHDLLESNVGLNKLAETPLFLTFICLCHEKIDNAAGGTLVELYFNIIWYLLDRHQKDFADRNVPLLFGFEQNSGSDKFLTIQDNYLQFPQLHFLGKMALKNIDKNVFEETDLSEHQLNSIIEQVGLLRKDENRDISLCRTTTFSFPHRTIHEFLAAFSFVFLFFSNETINIKTDHLFNDSSDSKKMTESQSFMWRIVSYRKMPKVVKVLNFESKQLEFCKRFTTLNLDTDIFVSSFEPTINYLNSFLLKCSNVKKLSLYTSTSLLLSNPVNLSKMTQLKQFNLRGIQSSALTISCNVAILPKKKIDLYFENVCFQSVEKYIESVKYFSANLNQQPVIKFDGIRISSNTEKDTYFLVYTKGETMENFSPLETIPNIFSDQVLNQALQYASRAEVLDIFQSRQRTGTLSFEFFTNLKEIYLHNLLFQENVLLNLPDLNKLGFVNCTMGPNARISFNFMKKLPILQTLQFLNCKINENAFFIIENCQDLKTLDFRNCTINVTAWQSIIEEISNRSITCMKLSINIFQGKHVVKFLEHLQKCEGIETLWIECRLKTIYWKSFEEKFTSILSNFALKMTRLNEIHLHGQKLKKSNKEMIETAGRINRVNFKLTQ